MSPYTSSFVNLLSSIALQAQLHKKSGSDAKEVMLKLVGWTLQCLDLDAIKQLPLLVSFTFSFKARQPSVEKSLTLPRSSLSDA